MAALDHAAMNHAHQGFRLEGVSVRAGDAILLDGIELELPASAWTVVLGASGSGKTTLLRLLNRLSDPSTGRVCWAGRALTDYDVRALRRQVGMVVQQPRLGQGRAQDALDLPVRLGGVDAATARERLPRVCEIAQLPQSLLGRELGSLSGGERQRLALARTLLLEPRALLLDEPTAALDRDTARALLAALERLRRDTGITVVAVTHRVEELAELAELCVVLAAGRVAEQGAPKHVLHGPQSEVVRALSEPAPA
jgi:ABC-type methionine transport system ATPase subunit